MGAEDFERASVVRHVVPAVTGARESPKWSGLSARTVTTSSASDEPTRVMLRDGTELHGSLLTLDEQLRAPGSVALHARCYDIYEASPSRATPRQTAERH